MGKATKAKKTLRELFKTQKFCVLSTINKNQPYSSLVGFWGDDDLKEIVFVTDRSTRKYSYISENSRVAVLIDTRTNQDTDLNIAIAATATGEAEEISGIERDHLQSLFLEKHPLLIDFVTTPSCALMRIKIDCYFIVNRFQNVVEVHIK